MKTKLLCILSLLIFCSEFIYSQISEAKKQQIESVYDRVYWNMYHNSNYSIIMKNGKEGIIDDKGNVLFPCRYDGITKYDGYFEAKLGGKVGIFNLKGEMLLDFKYNDVYWWQTKDLLGCDVKLDGKKGFIDMKGNVLVPCEYDKVSYYPRSEKDYLADVEKNGKKGVYDVIKGRLVIPCEYDKVSYYPRSEKDYLADVEKNGKKGVYDVIKGRLVVPCEYDDTRFYHCSEKFSFVEFCRNKKWGIYDMNKSKETIPCEYSYLVRDGECNYAVACTGGIYVERVLDKKTYEFIGGYFTENGKWGCIDMRNGNVVVPFMYDALYFVGENLFKCNVGGKTIIPGERVDGGLWGVVDSNNKVLFTPEYTEIGQFKDGVAQVVKDGVASIIVNPYSGTKLQIANGGSTCPIDSDIPTIERTNDETFAFVFANENYKNCSGADYAINDGKVFAKYCRQTLGIPESNVKYYEDATFGNMQSALKKMQDVADVYDGDAKIIFYFSGLGFTDNNQRYILPSDASLSSVASTGVSVENVLSVLNGLNTKYTFALFDAPFNGTDKSGKMLEAARGVKIKSKAPISSGRTIAVFGSSDDKNSYCYEKNVHGLLTYNILQQLQQSKGQCGIKTLIENAIKDVEKSSLKEFKDVQSPQIVISESMKENWQNLKF